MLGFGTDGLGVTYPLAGDSREAPIERPPFSGSDSPQVATLLGHLAMVLQEVRHDGSRTPSSSEEADCGREFDSAGHPTSPES